ncbi:MAG: class I SAM-dependent methyltransferase, partial [Rhodospirillales bacterium]|nr:class I SAM-dependent methyltransferase [Rhodospirillales bacterium]
MIKTEWDYSDLAKFYGKRPPYADPVIDRVLSLANISSTARICDVGAGTGHLTVALLKRGYTVVAVEPNDAMRAFGIEACHPWPEGSWHAGTGEATGQPAAAFDLVTFGSSFNVVNRQAALRETARILKPRGWFACLWNHRDLDDPLQAAVEKCIRRHVPDYDYGTRRADQAPVIAESGLFEPATCIEGTVRHRLNAADWIEAWRSHA